MKDLRGQLDVFVTTNGRSTFPYVLKSIEEQQGVKFDHHIIKDKPWIDANLSILSSAKSKFFLRVDDDMMLHSLCLSYMGEHLAEVGDNISMKIFKLWEPYTNTVCNGIKFYQTIPVRKIGFRINKIGKIDGLFKSDSNAHGYRISSDRSIMGIHSCSTSEEHISYANMRGENRGANWGYKLERLKKCIGKYNVSLQDQFSTREHEILRINRRHQSGFFKFLSK